MYKPLQIQAPQTGNAKNPPLDCCSKYRRPRGLYLENCPQIQSNGKFTSNYKASPIDFETQISLRDKPFRIWAPSKNKPLKKGLWKI